MKKSQGYAKSYVEAQKRKTHPTGTKDKPFEGTKQTAVAPRGSS